MPRLTNQLPIWSAIASSPKPGPTSKPIFSVVSVTQQWAVPRYYRTQADLPDADLLRVRADLAKAAPSRST
jgi:hypothetical protein